LWPWLLALLFLIVGGALAGYFLTRGNDHPRVVVPSVVGQSERPATVTVQRAGFRTQIQNRFSSRQKGLVIAESPAAGTKLRKGAIVTLTVSRGQQAVTVPNLISLPQAQAVAQLTKAGLNADVVLVPSSQPKGTVVAQSPTAGNRIDPGSTVRVNVSQGRVPTRTVTTTATVTTTRTTTTVTTTGTTTTVPTTTTVTTTPASP
jgi:serine/threonine-protein kinase